MKEQFFFTFEEGCKWLTVTQPQRIRSRMPYVQQVGYFKALPGYFVLRKGMPSYLFVYCLSGKGVLKYGGAEEFIEPGDCFWIDCRLENYYAVAEGNASWEIAWTHFNGNQVKGLYEEFLENNHGRNRLYVGETLLFTEKIHSIIDNFENADRTVYQDIAASEELSKIMYNCNYIAISGNKKTLPTNVQRAKDYIKENYAGDITLEDLAAYVSLDKYYLVKQFKKTMGCTPRDYLINVRLQHSKKLLEETDMPISQIAYETGFSDASHFSNTFYKREGMTPKEHRRFWINP